MQTSMEEYSKARKAALKQYRSATLSGNSPYPAVLDDILSNTDTVGEQPLGLCEIPLDMIAGTKTSNRKTAFTRDFLPLLSEKTEFASKWAQLYKAHMEEGIRDPVKVYEFMNRYYVEEGNKRVSVLKYVNAASIYANITRIVPARTEEKENKIYYEYMTFYDLTQINSFWFSEPGGYTKLLTALGKKPKEEWSQTEKDDLKSVFYHFSVLYRLIGKNNLPLSPSDAFLIYLTIFDYSAIKKQSANEMRQSIQKVWKEFAPAVTEQSVEHQMAPEKAQTPFWNKLISPAPSKLKIAFFYDKSIQESSWLYSHELGRLHLAQTYPKQVTTSTYENVKPGESADQILEEAIKEGNQVIFTTTPTLIQASLKAAVEHPEIKILNCSLNFSYRSIRTYYARVYEAKFLLGLIAGSLSKTDEIGYEADYPIYGTAANINAFALGAQMVNPDVKIRLFWSSLKEEFQPEEQKHITIFSNRDMITPTGGDRQFGLYAKRDGNVYNLATTILNWGQFYNKIVQSIFSGTWKSEESKKKSINYWWGLSSEVLDVICSSKIPYGTKHLVDTFRNMICSGAFHPFEGILYDQEGKEHGAEGGIMTNEEIISMDWLLNNVIGTIPELKDLKEDAKSVVMLQGIQEELL